MRPDQPDNTYPVTLVVDKYSRFSPIVLML